MLAKLKPVAVSVTPGRTIVDAGDRVTEDQYEMATAYRKAALEGGAAELDDGLELFGRVLLVLAMVLASILYVRLEDPETLASNVRLGLLALVVIFNLALVRAVYSVGGAELFVRDATWASALPYLAPTALAPIIVAILIDAGSAIFMALLISIFTGVIYGNRLDLLVLTFLASMVAIFGCREARRRGRVVRAAGMGGLTVAAFAALIGVAQQTPYETLVWQMAAGLLTGLLTGVAVVGLLPVLEGLFKRTTDITLLELTDFNHPLLRRMQLEAPGTYHHSLVVAQLSENASNAIGANPLLARACALFHDIGKAANPAYFTENQRNSGNPHNEKDPAVSAAIIRQHVADGVDLALRHHLPRAVIDVIRQHHGTTLVKYFYERALALSQSPFPGVEPPSRPGCPIPLRGSEAPVQGERRGLAGRRRRGRHPLGKDDHGREAGGPDRQAGRRPGRGRPARRGPDHLRGPGEDKEQLHVHAAQHAPRQGRLLDCGRSAERGQGVKDSGRLIEVAVRHPRLRVDKNALAGAIGHLDAEALCFRGGCPPGELSVVFLTDRSLALLHGRFLGDSSRTDVITFAGDPPHGAAGEICVSADAARRSVGRGARVLSRELTLYVVHGWLHLAGYDDLRPAAKRAMRRAEARAMLLLERRSAVPSFKLA